MAHREEGCVKIEAEMAMVLPPDKGHLGPPRAGRSKNSPPFSRSVAPPTP